MINWDWKHSNEIVISMGPKMQPHVKKTAGVTFMHERPVFDPDNVRQGACASKSYLWSKRCLEKEGRQPHARLWTATNRAAWDFRT
jgi:hypothetical protein